MSGLAVSRWTYLSLGLLLISVGLFPATSDVHALTITLPGTGFDANGNPWGNYGIDANWTVSGSQYGGSAAYVIVPGDSDWWTGTNPWSSNNASSGWSGSSWINDTTLYGNGGSVVPYTYSMSFSLARLQLNGDLQISGYWGIDDTGTLAINGHTITTGHLPWCPNPTGFSILYSANPTWFNAGTNTISITMTWTDDSCEGVRFQGTVTGDPSPSSWNVDSNGNWSAAANWTNSVVPNAVNGLATFGNAITAPRTVTVDTPVTLGFLTFASSNQYALSGSQAVTLQASGSNSAINDSNGSHAISSPLIMASNTDVTVLSATDTLTISGSISGAGMSLNKYGSGALVLNGASSYSGSTSLNAGVLCINNPSAIGTGRLVMAGGSIDNSSSGSITLVTNNAQTWNSSFTFVGSQDLNLGAGPVTLGTNCQVAVNSHRLFVGGAILGSYSLTKTGSGTLVLSSYNYYSGGTIVNGGILQVANTAALGTGGLAIGGSGTVDLNSFVISLPSLSGSSGAVITDNSIPASQPAPTVLKANISSGTSNYSGAINKGANGQDITIQKNGAGCLNLSGTSNYSGGTFINQGTFAVNGAILGGGNVQINTGTTLSGSGIVRANILGQAGSSIVATGNIALGESTSFTGFNHAGTLTIGTNAVTLNCASFANLGTLTTIDGGTLSAPNGISLGVGCTLSGSGTVNAAVAAGYGSTINATGNLVIGDNNSYDGFVSNGRLYTHSSTVTLNSGNAANNSNAVALGSLTQIDGGGLLAQNGILLDSGCNLITTDNGGTVGGGTASRFLNLGNVQGPSSASSNWLTFNMPFKGGTGQTSGQISFAGGFATGNSPGVNTQYGSAKLGGVGTEFDIGGTSPGNNDGNYGQLNVATNPSDVNNRGNLAFLPAATIKIVDWKGFAPTPGETFKVLTWDGTLTGAAALSVDPGFVAQGIQFLPQWNSNSLVIAATAAVSNWTGKESNKWNAPANWSTNGVPNGAGLEASFGTAASNPATVTVDSPETVGTLQFNSSAGYTLQAGTSGQLTLDNNVGGTTGGQIVVLSGSHSIAVPLVIANRGAAVTLSVGSRLAISTPITEAGGAQSLLLAGEGTLILSGTNSYSGGTYVTGGTLVATSPSSLRDGSSLTVGDATGFASPAVGLAPSLSSTETGNPAPNATAVPEPAGFALSAGGVLAMLGYALRRKRVALQATEEKTGQRRELVITI